MNEKLKQLLLYGIPLIFIAALAGPVGYDIAETHTFWSWVLKTVDDVCMMVYGILIYRWIVDTE